ncbi:MAG: hypothetical protein IPP97_17320 [Candidatus Obscuribacter sp.]|nr:hypothetical protein [Candidatus Obscuribacter sp.]
MSACFGMMGDVVDSAREGGGCAGDNFASGSGNMTSGASSVLGSHAGFAL